MSSLQNVEAKHRAPVLNPPIIVPEIEWDIEEELEQDDKAHAIPVCREHRGPDFHPLRGTIVEAICGTLFRWRMQDRPKFCSNCAAETHKTFNCYVCGKEIYGL